ncbi:MAG: phosphoglycerate dehydrogenase [Candidatus Omnitrophica bacterium]|nr:phosphoglycerate dehydrogenase [Candidatus Omnitrophota bacterium]
MPTFKILISDPLSKEGVDILRKNKDFYVEEVEKLKEDQLVAKIKDFDALIVRSGTVATKKIIDAGVNLKVIGRAGVGLDNVDLEAASKKGIVVMNTPTGNTISTAEHAFTLMMSLARSIPLADKSVKDGKWDRKKFMGVELYGKVLGIVGLGRIGSEFAKRAQSFGMKVMAYDPFLTQEKAKSLNVEPVDLPTLYENADFITIHTPLTEETKHLIGEEAFKRMKKGVRIINAARGGIIDEAALAKYIASGKVAGAALDVYESKATPPVDSPVYGMESVITTPHLGASTEEAQLNVSIDIAECVQDALLGKGYRNAANMPFIPEESLALMKPYILLAERMGSFQTQLIEEPIKEVKVKYAGDISNLDVSVITRALMKGIFEPILVEHVNYINSVFIAKERGISVTEKKTTEVMDFANLICVEFVTEKKEYLIMGTLFGNKEPRIVMIDEFYVEAIPGGVILVISNNDIPGIVGKIGTIIGKAEVNIAGINLGRNKKKKLAISLLNLDSELPKEVIKKLSAIEGVTSVKQVKI